MTIAVGSRVGPYEILAPLGAGGMGEVYRARDAKLNRDVAIKVLPELFTLDRDRLTRFRREAQVLASLNHQNIGHIYGLEDTSGLHALVLELVEGPTLADRIAEGPIPLDEAIPIARQIADALECAHEQGIIHRDLKPANIKLRPDGTVKVLDFGLAKALDPVATSSPDAVNSPTLTARGTQLGIIIGTAAYMAPEQARGKAVDRRADIWAFGVVLYEMLAGKRAFEGDDVSITLAAVLKDEPDWKALPSDLPPPVRRVLRRCLEKDPKRRLSAIGDARLELDAALQPGTDETPPRAGGLPRLSWRHYAAIAGIGALGVALGALLTSPRSISAPPLPRIEFAVDTPTAVNLLMLALSPDGSHLAFIQRETAASPPRIWVRPLASSTARALEGTEDAQTIFWSADSRRIGFTVRNRLSTIALSGGRPLPVCPVQQFGGATWNANDVILFSDWTTLWRVSGAGGQPTKVLELDPALKEERLLGPSFLPDGRRFVFLSWTGGLSGRNVYMGSLESPARTRITVADTVPIYAAGHLLFTRQRTLFAQQFDTASGTTKGEPTQLASGLMVALAPARAAFSASETGILTYRSGGENQNVYALKSFDRAGREQRTFDERGAFRQIRLSPNSRWLAIETRDQTDVSDLSTMDVTTGIATRLTFDHEGAMDPAWSPDSREIAYTRRRGSRLDIYKTRVGETRTAPMIVEGDSVKFVDDWSPDGRLILFRTLLGRTAFSAPASGGGTIATLPAQGDGIDSIRLSPDGNRVAFQSRESERLEVYVADFPTFARRTRVSANGGAMPRWRGDGRELYYMALDRTIMAVAVGDFAGNTFGVPIPLFPAPVPAGPLNAGIDLYDSASNGQRFYVIAEEQGIQRSVPPITVVVNWLSGLPQK